MASLTMPRPSQSTSASCSSPIPSRCSFGDQNPTFSFSFRDSRSRVHVCNAAAVRCDMAEALNFPNGKPNIPVLNERTLPKFLETARMEKTVNRTTNNRIKLFSGTANPALSQAYPDFQMSKVV